VLSNRNLSNPSAASRNRTSRTNASALLAASISFVSDDISASLRGTNCGAGVVIANWRTGMGAPSCTKLTLLMSATKLGSDIVALPSKESCKPFSNNCTPADAGPSAARKSAMIVLVSAVVFVKLAGVLAPRTKYAAATSVGQCFTSRRSAAGKPAPALRAIASTALVNETTLSPARAFWRALNNLLRSVLVMGGMVLAHCLCDTKQCCTTASNGKRSGGMSVL